MLSLLDAREKKREWKKHGEVENYAREDKRHLVACTDVYIPGMYTLVTAFDS